MKILKATHLGMCFGVRDAIDLALERSREENLTVLGELVHNETVNQSLRVHGIDLKRRLQDVRTSTVMITAHGASQQAITRVRERGHHVIEATCPLVHFAHRSLMELVRDGCHPVIIGLRDHVEVRGLTGDLKHFDIVLTEDDILELTDHPRFGVVAQTTQPIDKVRGLVDLIRLRFPRSEVRFRDTVCQPTKQRQSAAAELAQQCDVVVVVGGVNSNNTRELVATCSRYCDRVLHIQGPADLKPCWFYNAETIGLTAGTSTPDEVIDAVEQRLKEWAVETTVATMAAA